MATTPSDTLSFSTPTLAGLLVAGVSLGAAAVVYAFGHPRSDQRGTPCSPGAPGEDAPANAHNPANAHTASTAQTRARPSRGDGDGDRDEGQHAVVSAAAATARKARRRKKTKDVGAAEAEPVVPFPRVLPGSLEDPDADVGPSTGRSPPGVVAGTAPDIKIEEEEKKKNRKKKKKPATTTQTHAREWDEGDDGGREASLETGKEVGCGRTAARSGESTDASVSLYPSVSVDALPPSRATVAKGSLGANARLSLSSHPHEVRPELSLDTDSSWTHVDRRRLKTSKSVDGHAPGLPDAVDMTSSDLASPASDSPVAERMDSMMALRGPRADLSQRTLAEKLVPSPRKTGVEDMLEQPDLPTLARVVRVQPRPDDMPVPGFSWEDYGDLIEDSVLVHDADEEDEGDWGVVKSRHRARHPQTTMTESTTTVASTSHALTAPESMTKKQRQNARRRELTKAVKVEAETARLEGLAKHKRELERLRIIEQSRQSSGKLSGGMRATVDDRGKLVWE